MSRKIEIKGMKQLIKKLDRVTGSAARRITRAAVKAGGNVLLRAIKPATPKDQGVLRRAQTVKLSGKRRTNARAVVGAEVTKMTVGTGRKSTSERSKGAEIVKQIRPSNLDWLVEYGHVTPGGIFVPPSGRLRQTAEQAMPRAQEAAVARLREELEQELSR